MNRGKVFFIRSFRNCSYNKQFRPSTEASRQAESSALLIGTRTREFSSTATSEDLSERASTPSATHEDWYSPVEYESPWESTSSWLKPLSSSPSIDIRSRHLIQLLQELNKFGATLSQDRLTTQRCNTLLKELDQLTPKSFEIASRSLAIVQAMQLFEKRFTTPKLTPRFALPKLPFAIPKPDKETYDLMLRILSKSPSHTRELADAALSIVTHMQERDEITDEFNMQPDVTHWNNALLAWKCCTVNDRHVHAAKILLKSMLPQPIFNSNSFTNVFLTCRQRDSEDGIDGGGAKVATIVWDYMCDYDKKFPSISFYQNMPPVFFSFFLLAIRSLPNHHPDNGIELRAEYCDDCFGKACEYGKVNQRVLVEFVTCLGTHEVRKKYLEEYDEIFAGRKLSQACELVYQVIPPEWKSAVKRPEER